LRSCPVPAGISFAAIRLVASAGPSVGTRNDPRELFGRSAPRALWRLLRATAREWWDDDVFQLAAALAFYTIFSMAPVVTIALWIAGVAFGTDAATRALVDQVRGLVGPNGAQAVEGVIDGISHARGGLASSALAFGTLVLGSTAVFGQLQTSLNRIWDVKPQRHGSALERFVKKRLLSFGLVVALGFLLLVSLVVSAVLTALHDAFETSLPGLSSVWRIVDFAVSFGLAALLFCAVYKILPDAEIAWRDVAIGGFVTAALFTLGKIAIGLYLGRTSIGSAYGAAGSFVVFVAWIYYSAIVCFFGAEFTQVYARSTRPRIQPEEFAMRVGDKSDEPPVCRP
jgi:membrane protein